MQRSVETSELLHFRAKSVVNERMKAMNKSIQEYDFETFGELTMKDSNQFHATCLDSYPPIFYLNETSKRIIDDIHAFNESMGSIKVFHASSILHLFFCFTESALGRVHLWCWSKRLPLHAGERSSSASQSALEELPPKFYSHEWVSLIECKKGFISLARRFVYDPMQLSGPLEHDSELSTSGVSRIILTKVSFESL